MKISKTYIGIIATFILALAPTLGLEVSEDTLMETLNQVAILATAAFAIYGRYDAGGIDAFGIKKK